jgi:hypothetical protein
MIRHIVFFSVRDRKDVERVRTGLMELGSIPHSRFFEVALNDKVDPTYAETTARIRPLRELRFSADFTSSAP